MKKFLICALFAAGVGLTGASSASAAVAAQGLNNATVLPSLVENTALVCRRISTCHRGYNGRRYCSTRRVCRSYW